MSLLGLRSPLLPQFLLTFPSDLPDTFPREVKPADSLKPERSHIVGKLKTGNPCPQSIYDPVSAQDVRFGFSHPLSPSMFSCEEGVI